MKVMYNGGKICHHGCTEPVELQKNNIYDVKDIKKRDGQTYYTLKEVEGYFNSRWFDNLSTYMALAGTIPKIGEPLECQKIIGDKGKLVEWVTSTVQDVIEMYGNLYEVHTLNSIYIVQIL